MLNAFDLAEKMWPLIKEAESGVSLEILQERLAKELGVSEKLMRERQIASGTDLVARKFDKVREVSDWTFSKQKGKKSEARPMKNF